MRMRKGWIMPPAKKTATGAVRSIEPGYAEALLAYASILHKGGAKGGRAEEIALKIEVGRDVGLPPTQACAFVMIVNGKPTIWGDAALALIRASGLLEDVEETYEGDPEPDENGRPTNRNFTAVCTVKRIGSARPRTERFSVGDAIRANLWTKKGPWQEYPTRQLMWRAKGFACRDEFQDVLCGCIFTEEAMDIPGVRITEPISAETTSSGPPSPTNVTDPVPTVVDGSAKGASVPDVVEPGPVTSDQLHRLAELRNDEMVSRSIRDDDEDSQRTVWLEWLHPYRVTSARDLSTTQAADLIDRLNKKHDFPENPPPPGSGPAK